MECIDDSSRTAPHASVNDNDTLADQKEALDEIQQGVMNRNYRSAHVLSDVYFTILGRNAILSASATFRAAATLNVGKDLGLLITKRVTKRVATDLKRCSAAVSLQPRFSPVALTLTRQRGLYVENLPLMGAHILEHI